MKKIVLAVILMSLAQAVLAAPATWVQAVTNGGEVVTMRLTLQNLRGPNFELWTQNSNGTYNAETPVAERSYLGTVDEDPAAISFGILRDDGVFKGGIYFDRGSSWYTIGGSVDFDRGMDQPSSYGYPDYTVNPGQIGSSMYGFDVGIDARYEYFTDRGGSNVDQTFEAIEYSVAATRAMYMHDALLRPYLGRIIVRTDPTQDPASGLTGGTYLDAVRNEWNNNHTDADRDVVAGVAPSHVWAGLAWVNVIGSSSAYSVNDSGGDGNFSIVWRHEMGHNWGLGHYDGGAPEGSTINCGNQYARMSGPELHKVLNHRNGRLGIFVDEGVYVDVDLPPYAAIDGGTFVQVTDTQTVIDVLANDHDANGDALSLLSFDATTGKGGTVTQLGQTLVYTPPSGFVGVDSFTYVIQDSSGQTATGAVGVDVQPNDVLRLYLPLDETSGDALTDLSVFGNNGTFYGTNLTAASVTGPFGNAINLDGVDDHARSDNVKLSGNTVTITAWVKQGATQNPWAGIVFDRTASATGLNVGESGELRYHWNDSQWNWNSGLTPPTDTWTFVALVVEPSQATIYMNSGSGFQTAVNNASHSSATFGSTYVGRDPNQSRYFKGAIDEARLYNYSLSLAELQNIYVGGGAESPNPQDGSAGITRQTVEWTQGAGAVSNEIYVGTSQAAVAAATKASPEYRGSTTETFFKANLADSTTHYWRIDTVTAAGTVMGTVWSFTTDTVLVGDTILVNFEENSNQTFDGGQLIGPTADDSSNWNAVGGASGSLSDLIDNAGDLTQTTIEWDSSTLWYNNDGISYDEHRMSVGYLDDGNSGSGKGVTVTVSNIPYATYKVYGLFATDENGSGSTATVNFNVNGSWALGGDASTTASAWGSIGANYAAHGSYWTEIVPGSVQGNYWTVESAGATCSIVGELKNGTTRGCLTAVIIENTGGPATTNAPTWNSSPVNKGEIAANVAITGSLAGDADDFEGDPLTFSKVSGPAWLSIAPNGDLGGTPSSSDVGSNSWTVTVTDGITAPVTNTLNVSVVSITTVDVDNYSFELPGTSKQTDWEAVPGWSSDSVASDSGVENANATDGSWAGYLMDSDPAVWTLTDEFIAPGEVYTLRVDAKNTGSGDSLRIILYYDNAGSRVPLATLDAALTGTMQEFVLPYNADDVPAAIGQYIGVELDNVVGGWVGFDHIRLTRTGAPDSDGDQMPDWWENEKGLDPYTKDATLHSDADAFDNAYEYATDTDPKDGNSWQTFSLELASGTGIPTLHFGTSTRRNYVVEYRDDLTGGTWQELVPAFVGDGTEMAQPDPATTTNRFYRLRVELP